MGEVELLSGLKDRIGSKRKNPTRIYHGWYFVPVFVSVLFAFVVAYFPLVCTTPLANISTIPLG